MCEKINGLLFQECKREPLKVILDYIMWILEKISYLFYYNNQ